MDLFQNLLQQSMGTNGAPLREVSRALNISGNPAGAEKRNAPPGAPPADGGPPAQKKSRFGFLLRNGAGGSEHEEIGDSTFDFGDDDGHLEAGSTPPPSPPAGSAPPSPLPPSAREEEEDLQEVELREDEPEEQEDEQEAVILEGDKLDDVIERPGEGTDAVTEKNIPVNSPYRWVEDMAIFLAGVAASTSVQTTTAVDLADKILTNYSFQARELQQKGLWVPSRVNDIPTVEASISRMKAKKPAAVWDRYKTIRKELTSTILGGLKESNMMNPDLEKPRSGLSWASVISWLELRMFRLQWMNRKNASSKKSDKRVNKNASGQQQVCNRCFTLLLRYLLAVPHIITSVVLFHPD